MMHYWQNDPRWKNVHLGTSHTTIGREGCLLCAVADALEDYAFTPPALNRWLVRNRGFADSNRFVFASVESLGLRLLKLVDCNSAPAPVDEIVEAINKELIVLAQASVCPPSVCQHWVRVVDYTLLGGELDLLIHDPMKPSAPTRLLPYYALPNWDLARAIYRVAFYERCPTDL